MTVSRAGKRGKRKTRIYSRNGAVRLNASLRAATGNVVAQPEAPYRPLKRPPTSQDREPPPVQKTVLRDQLRERDGHKCLLCGDAIDFTIDKGPRRWSLDHIIPYSKGGTWALGNLRLAHKECNAFRGDAKEELEFHPSQIPVPGPLAEHPEYVVEGREVRGDNGIEVEFVTYNRAHTVFDKWVYMDECFFLRRHIRVVEHARELWRTMAAPSTVRTEEWFFETGGAVRVHDDEWAARAHNLIRRASNLVPAWKWTIFENVIRWNEPYGFPGSRLYGDKPQRERWAKLVVYNVAETISKSLFL